MCLASTYIHGYEVKRRGPRPALYMLVVKTKGEDEITRGLHEQQRGQQIESRRQVKMLTTYKTWLRPLDMLWYDSWFHKHQTSSH